MKRTMTLSGDAALAVKYAIALARVKNPEFATMSDEDILSQLIDMGIDSNRNREVQA